MLQKRFLLLMALVVLSSLLAACVVPQPTALSGADVLYQTSTLSALQAGDFEGAMTIGALKQQGDFGLGTFNALDGEMVMLDGQVYQAKVDGVAYLADDAALTPYAAVTFFEADQTFAVAESLTCADFQAYLDEQLPTVDAPYAIKVSGLFASLQVRAPHRQSAPYVSLAEALIDQVVFDSENATGTMVGFRLPEYMAGINAVGYHFHYIGEDRKSGGHVLDCETGSVTVEIDTIGALRMDGIVDDVAVVSTQTVSAVATTRTDAPTVFAVYATSIEEPWVGVIHSALLAAQEAGDITYSYADELGLDGEMGQTLRQRIADSPPDIVFGDTFGNWESLREIAQEHPEIAFVLGSDQDAVSPNISVFNSWAYEPAYLGGMLAGGMTKSNRVGIVAGFSERAVNRAVNAFIAGTAAVNPEVEALTTYIDSWYDLEAAGDATRAQIDAGVDIIFAERAGVIEMAAEHGVYTIGNLLDQRDAAPEYVVTSALWNMESTVQHVIEQVAAGTYTAEDLASYTMMANGGSRLAPINQGIVQDIVGGIAEELLARVEDRQGEITRGEFQVPIDESRPPAVVSGR